MATELIEWAPFTLLRSVDEAQLLRASDAFHRDFLEGRPGFLRRELLKGSGGQWIDLVYWESEEASARAMQEAAESPAVAAYFQLMVGADQPDFGAAVLHFTRARAYIGSRQREAAA